MVMKNNTNISSSPNPQAWLTQDDDQPEFLTPEEAGELLRHSRSWVYLHRNELPHVLLPGGGMLFLRTTLLEWAEKRVVWPPALPPRVE